MAHSNDREIRRQIRHDRERRRINSRRYSSRRTRSGFSHEKALIFGVAQLLCGISAVILGVVAVASKAWGYQYGNGFWAGAIFIIAGVFGIVSSKRKAKKSIIGLLLFSTIATITALVLIGLTTVGIVSDHVVYKRFRLHIGSSLVVHSLLIVVGLVEGFFGIFAAVIGCRGTCGPWYGKPNDPAVTQALTRAESSRSSRSSSSSRRTSRNRQHHSRRSSSHNTSGRSERYREVEEVPPILVPPYSPPGGHQQIAIVGAFQPSPVANSSSIDETPQTAYIMQAAGVAGGFSQVMCVMQGGGGPVNQLGYESEGSQPVGTPPPSYSQIDLAGVGIASEVVPRDSEDNSRDFTNDISRDLTIEESSRDLTAELSTEMGAAGVSQDTWSHSSEERTLVPVQFQIPNPEIPIPSTPSVVPSPVPIVSPQVPNFQGQQPIYRRTPLTELL